MADMPEPLLTVQEVARRVGKSVRTVHRAIDDGSLVPAMRAGTGENAPYLFGPAEVDRWIAARSKELSEDEGKMPA